MKAYFSHPMSWMFTLYIVAFLVAACIFGPVALLHPLGVLTIVGTFLWACSESEQDANIKNAIRRKRQ